MPASHKGKTEASQPGDAHAAGAKALRSVKPISKHFQKNPFAVLIQHHQPYKYK